MPMHILVLWDQKSYNKNQYSVCLQTDIVNESYHGRKNVLKQNLMIMWRGKEFRGTIIATGN